MASNNEKLEKLKRQFSQVIELALKPSITRPLAEKYADLIRRRTRLGYGVGEGFKQTKLLDLADSTKEQRDRYSENLSSATTPNRSNLTATGQLLDAIEGKGSEARIEIIINDARDRNLSGKKSKIGNKELAGYVQKTRPFFALSSSQQKELVRDIKNELVSAIKKLLK